MSRSALSGSARSIALVLSCLLLLVACAATTPSGPTGDPSLLPGEEAPSPGEPDPTATSDTGEAPTTQAPGSGSPGTGPTPPPAPGTAPTYLDAGGVGRMATTYLRASPARRLIVEVDYVAGRAPSPQVLEHLAGILRREARKPDGIVVEHGNEIPSERNRYSFEDIDRLERQHRQRRSGGSVATMYLLYLNGELAEESGALGVAYTASSAVIFIDRIRSAASALVQPGAIERAVVVHEAGHLLALVNIGYQSRHDHEDPDHPHHSRYRDSVMYWAVEDISVTSILTGGPPSDFNRYDRDDLAQLRGD